MIFNKLKPAFSGLCFALFLSCFSGVPALAQESRETASRHISDTIWSPLTDFEINTLKQAKRAQSGDPDALLALAVLASGDIRSKQAFTRIQAQVHRFITRIKPRLSQIDDSWRKGFELHSAMHDAFFMSSEPDNELQGYRADQSQFSRIFKDKTYNCISSSILFLILARYFDMQVEGVVLPTHSFVQLTTPEGHLVEIETTTKSGYGIRHNRTFYASNERQNWFQRRNLVPTTYQDYLNRKIVSGYRLIVDNMNQQHTAVELMAQEDRYRLQELRGWLLPNDPEAQLYRFYVINNELIRLQKGKQNQQAKKLINKAETIIASYQRKSVSGQENAATGLDMSVFPIISYIYTSKANIAFSEGLYKMALDSLKESLHWVREPEQASKIIRNIAITQLNQANIFSSNKDYDAALKLYRQAYAVVNSLTSAEDTELKNKINHNIGAAYWNMAVPLLNRGDSYSAYELLDQCRTHYPQVQKCRQGLSDICQTYSLPVCAQ